MSRILWRPACLALALLIVAPPTKAQGDASVTQIAAILPGQEVTLRGVVQRITDEDEFILSDTSGRVRVYVGPNAVPARVGEAITVSGRVDDDAPREVYARLIIRADGTQVALSHSYSY